MMIVTAVASVHENVQKWTSENYQPRQPPKQMGTMLGDQIEGTNGHEPPQRNGRGGDAPRRLIVVAGLSSGGCHNLLWTFCTAKFRGDAGSAASDSKPAGSAPASVAGWSTMFAPRSKNLDLCYSFACLG